MSRESKDPKALHPSPPQKEHTQAHPGHDSEMQQQPDYGERSYKGHGRLTGKVALITGADSGIGRAVALAYAREGADVAIAYLNEHDDAKVTERLVREAGRRALLLPGDLAEPQVCREIVARTARELGRLDILVNNAAFQGKAVESFAELDEQRWERTFRVNIIAMFYTVKAALEHMKEGGSIINTASVQAYKPQRADPRLRHNQGRDRGVHEGSRAGADRTARHTRQLRRAWPGVDAADPAVVLW